MWLLCVHHTDPWQNNRPCKVKRRVSPCFRLCSAFFLFCNEWPCLPSPHAGAEEPFPRGPHQTVRGNRQLYPLPEPTTCLCTFYKTSLNNECRARLSGDGPRGNFTVFVEWVLVSCGSPLTVDFAGDDSSPTSDPEPSPPSPRAAEHQLEPTADGEPEPSATDEPSPSGATVLRIAPEPEPITSDQVREPATSHVTVDVRVSVRVLRESPAHCHRRWGWEQSLGLWGFYWLGYLCRTCRFCFRLHLNSLATLNYLPTWIAHPPTHPPSLSCRLLSSLPLQLCHRCFLAAPLLTLSPPSVRWDRRGSARLHQHHGWRIPCLRLQPLSPGLRLDPSTQWLPLRPSLLLYGARSHLLGGGRTVTTHWTLVLLSACVHVLISSLSH